MLDQMRSIDKSRLGENEGSFSTKEMNEIDLILKFVLGIQ
jgi:mRNA-degrading endonuclease toxin of MazEF toxin-antitoxin module